jgi:hypothetical protein
MLLSPAQINIWDIFPIYNVSLDDRIWDFKPNFNIFEITGFRQHPIHRAMSCRINARASKSEQI